MRDRLGRPVRERRDRLGRRAAGPLSPLTTHSPDVLIVGPRGAASLPSLPHSMAASDVRRAMFGKFRGGDVPDVYLLFDSHIQRDTLLCRYRSRPLRFNRARLPSLSSLDGPHS